MILKYLDWPAIPTELYPDVARIATTGVDEIAKFTGTTFDAYKFYPIDGALLEWLHANIPIDFGSCVHIHTMNNTLLVHKDYQMERYKVNYVFKTGGKDTHTGFYDDDHQLIESHQITPLAWHQFDGQVNHNVWGITPGDLRVAITLGTNQKF